VDRHYGVLRGGEFAPDLWRRWVNRNHILWPRLGPGRLDLGIDVFAEVARAHPAVHPMKELLASLTLLRRFELAVGRNVRNRCPLRPFVSMTGRNQPSTSRFIFGPATWVRGLIKPAECTALAYLDHAQQEFGVAAALSVDDAMKDSYVSGDPYLEFARQAVLFLAFQPGSPSSLHAESPTWPSSTEPGRPPETQGNVAEGTGAASGSWAPVRPRVHGRLRDRARGGWGRVDRQPARACRGP
jgi:hypothetical protein